MNIRSQESRVAYEGEHVMRDGTVHDQVWAVETKARNGKMKLVWYTDKEEFTKAISGKAELDVSAFNVGELCFFLLYPVSHRLI